MKKLAAVLCLGGILVIVVSIAQARSDWAFYKENPVQICETCDNEGSLCYIVEGYTGPRVFVENEDSAITNDGCEITYFTLDCCACHGPDAPGNHGGPELPSHQCQ